MSTNHSYINKNHIANLSDELALIRAIGLCVFVIFLLSYGADFHNFNLCCVLVQQPEVGLSIVRHLQQKMEQVIVYAHVRLLVIDLMDLYGDIRLGNR